jgi:SNF2 family DNA or RNA helicase
MTFKIGDQVSLKADPARQGLIVGGPRVTGTITRWQIHFLDGERNYHPEKAILKEGETLQDDDEFDQLKNFRFSKIDQLTLSLTHNKLSGRLANLIYSLDATNTTFYPHQFKPVLALIDTPAKGILIGDEVGLGKTIEAGLIWTELKTRYNSKRLIIICKAFLKTKWTNEFKEKFGINLQSVTPKELLEKIKNANDLDSFAYVSSYDALRPPKNWRRDSEETNDDDKNNSRKLLAEFLYNNQQKDLFDLVVFDECQYMRNEETMTYQLGQLFSKTSMQVVMLSATPINNSSDDLFNLFNILDESLFPYKSEFPRLISQNIPIIFTRDQLMSGKLKDRGEIIELLEGASQASLYKANEQLKFLLNNLPNQEILNTAKGRVDLAMQLDKINIFGKVFTRTRKRDVQDTRSQREATPFSIQMTETEKALYESVTNAVLEYASINDLKTGFLTNSPQQQMCSSFAAAVHWWRLKDAEYQSELIEQLDEVQSVESEQVDTKKIRPLFEHISQSVFKMGDLSDLEKNDSKYNKLRNELKSYWNRNSGKKIILFSFFKATLRYLKRRLEKDGVLSELLYGGINKDIALENFEKSSEVNLLLASEVASEGVDLQFSSLVINYDLPWNPMRVEQRIGRIDRIGQQEKKILIWNFFYKDSIDDRIYMKLYTKLRIFEEALGGMEEIIGDRLKLISKTKEYLEHNLNEEQVNTLLMQADQAVEYVEELEKQLDEKSSQLVAHDDFIQQSIQEARQFGRYIKAEDLIAYFETFIKEYYQPSTMHLINKEINSFTIDLTIQAIVAIQDYWNKEKINFSSALLDTQKIKKTKFVFSNKIAKNQASVEYINQFHPIIKFISDTLQKKYLSNPKKIVTASAVKTQQIDIPEDVYIYACQRFSFTSNVRVIERLEYRAKGLNCSKPLSADQSELLVNAITAEGKNWAGYGSIDAELLFENYGELLLKLEHDFENRLNQLKRETNDRVTLQQNSLMGYLINEKNRFDERIQNAVDQKKESYLKSLRTQWTNIENNIKVKQEKLESQKNLSGIPSFVSLGLVEFKR